MADIINVAQRADFNEWDDIRPHVDTQIRWNDDAKSTAPIHTMLMDINGTEVVHDTRFRWPERTADLFSVTVESAINVSSAGVAQAATILSQRVTLRDVIYHGPSRQRFQITAITNRNTAGKTVCEITKIPITSATTAVAAGAVCRVLPSLMNEGGFYAVGRAGYTTWYFNYTQLTDHSVDISNTMLKVDTWTGNVWQEMITEATINVHGKLERGFIYGSKIKESRTLGSETTSDTWTSDMQSSQGLDERITTHRTTYSGSLTKATFNAWIAAHVAGSRNSGPLFKTIVTGPTGMQYINDFADDKLQVFQGAQEYGLDIKLWRAHGGRQYAIVEEREFSNEPGYTNEDADTFYAIVPENFSLCTLGETYMNVKPTSLNNQDIKRVTYLAEGGYKIPQEHQLAKLSRA